MVADSDQVIVIGCYVPGVAVVRALANKGVYLVAMTYSGNDIAHLSKYVSESVRIPNPEKEVEQFIDFLISNGDRWQGALILETADHTAVPLSKYKSELSNYYKIVTPDWSILSQFIQKEQTYALAQACDIPHPESFTSTSLESLEKIIAKITFPCILKPQRSHDFVNRFKVKNFEVNNDAELISKFKLCLEAEQPVIIQEIIPGPDSNLYKLQGYINTRGEMVAKFFHRKVRQNPPRFGVMRVGISTERDPEVEQLTERILGHVGYRGYFSIEFKKDLRDNKLKLTENNCRMPRSGCLAIASGVNFPWIIYLDLVKNQQIDVLNYKKGVYWIELYADISNSIINHNKEDIGLRDYLRPYLARDKTFAVFDIHDMKPFLKLSSEKAKNTYRNVISKIKVDLPKVISNAIKDFRAPRGKKELKTMGDDEETDERISWTH